ncbi:HIT family protein [Catenuloplanes japonicus]|uniref:HIT family protein n=1 Tax=Catenuloplanes japonicus TaxID=33876 RepID=UPI000525B5B4|nr:HIT family protein [Catenuloplanes japonicus]
MADCVFCAIVAGTTPAFVVADTADGVAFLDTRPVFKGHVLVVPRTHVPVLTDLDLDLVGPFFALVRRLAGAVETGLGAGGTFVAMNNRVSQSVPHLHAHVVPRTKGDGLRGFFWPRTRYASDSEAVSFASQIKSSFAGTDNRPG